MVEACGQLELNWAVSHSAGPAGIAAYDTEDLFGVPVTGGSFFDVCSVGVVH